MRKTQNNKELVGELTESEIEFGKLLKKIKRMRKQDVKEEKKKKLKHEQG